MTAADEYEKILKQRPSLAEFLLRGTEWDDDFVEDVDQRNKSGARDLDL